MGNIQNSSSNTCSVSLVSVTPDAETLIGYCARVSSPDNQDKDPSKLLAYCVKNKHWSIFEMAHMTVEIECSRAISAQILRHKSFSFQEHSQRYAKATECVVYSARRQDVKNRQNSIDDISKEDQEWFKHIQTVLTDTCISLYQQALARGIAKECARFLLPMSVKTRLYMTGSIRSWIHYFDVRCDKATQLEHREIANAARAIFKERFPIIAAALE